MKKNLHDEKKYLEMTLKRFEDIIDYTEKRLEVIPMMYQDNPDLVALLLFQNKKRLALLKKTENRPYFARINFQNDIDDTLEECYIGKVGVHDEDNKIVTVDWRSPIASMYYDSNIGKASYEAPEGIITGNLLVKRQYDIEDKKLKGFQDVDTVSNDEILKPYLGVSADNRLKNIVATIQAEQNDIIRENLFNNLIIQGVAGSGKTTVALHRIAYLVYNNISVVDPSQYLVIGPSKFFVNYISGVLPDLDVDNVSQLTYDEIVKELLQENFELISLESKLILSVTEPSKLVFERLRVSMQFKELLDKFLLDFDKQLINDDDFLIKDYKILSNRKIKELFNSIESNDIVKYDILADKIDRVYLIIGKYIQEHYETILTDINKQYYEKTDKLSGKELELERKNLEYVRKELRNDCKQTLKKYFSKARPKILSLYSNFLENISSYINKLDYDIELFGKRVASNIKKKKVEFEDLSSLLYLYYRIYGSSNFIKYRHAVIDEAQDFGEFNFYVLKCLMPKCTFSIFGDLAQSIYQYRGIEDWNRVIDTTFDGKCDLKYLSKSYRTTTEIMNEANNITNYLNLTRAIPVIRHGVLVKYIYSGNNQVDNLLKILRDYKEKDYSSIAIICKDLEEATIINQQLRDCGIDIVNITNMDMEYNGGLCTITSYLAKGLEFDGVIITDASEDVYNSSKPIDMKLLYVAMTRPLHELNILYKHTLTKPLLKQ